VNSRAVFVSRFASALHEGRPPDVTAQDGLAVQAITEATYRSSADGTRVSPSDLVAGDAR
jgi:predicted dehydrogenase